MSLIKTLSEKVFKNHKKVKKTLCMTSVQFPYCNEKLGPVCCHNCGIVITDPEIISGVAKLKIKFSVVKASCGADTCPGHATQWPRKAKTTLSQRGKKRKLIKKAT